MKLVISVAALWIVTVVGATGVRADDPTDEAIAASRVGLEAGNASNSDTEVAAAGDTEVAAAYRAAMKFSYKNRSEAFAWQAVASKIIFALVIALVIFGAILTALQFRQKTNAVTAFKASTGGIEVTSPVLGVIILSLSLGFFYLYLANVYPIREIGCDSVAAAKP